MDIMENSPKLTPMYTDDVIFQTNDDVIFQTKQPGSWGGDGAGGSEGCHQECRGEQGECKTVDSSKL